MNLFNLLQAAAVSAITSIAVTFNPVLPPVVKDQIHKNVQHINTEKVSTKQSPQMIDKQITTKTPKENPGDKSTPSPSSNLILNEQIITTSGSYTYLGTKTNYNLSFPINGGQITGSINGLCNGNLDGIYEGNTTNKIDGKANVNCKLGFWSEKLEASFTGKVNLSEGKIEVSLKDETGKFNNQSLPLSLSFPPTR